MIILFGPAGSGKSTQGKLLAEKYGFKWLSVGQVLRDTGEFEETLKNGELVDDETVVRIMNKQIAYADAEGMNVILDGYPRDKKQTEIMLSDKESEFFDKIDGAIVLEVPKEELWKRIEARGRSDDTKAVVERRFDIFEQNICSIVPLLKSKNVKITTVDGTGTMAEVTQKLSEIVEEMMPGVHPVRDYEIDTKMSEDSYGE